MADVISDALQITTKTIDQIINTCNELLKSISQSIHNSPFIEKINEIGFSKRNPGGVVFLDCFSAFYNAIPSGSVFRIGQKLRTVFT